MSCFLFLGLFPASFVGACGGGGAKTTPKADQAKAGPRPTKAEPVTSAVRAVTPGANVQPHLGASARAKAGQPVQAVVRVLAQAAGQPLRVRLHHAKPQQWTVSAELAGGGTATSRITVADKGLELSRLVYSCRLSPATFCPGRATRAGKGDATLRFPGRSVPVSLSILFDRPGTIKPRSLVKLGPAGVRLRTRLQVQSLPPAGSGKPAAPAVKASVAAGSRLRVLVRPLADSGSGTLRITVPKATGHRITVQAQPSAGRRVASATVEGQGGPVRLADPSWACELPPATFCPVTAASASKGGFSFALPMPRVPVQLIFQVRKG